MEVRATPLLYRLKFDEVISDMLKVKPERKPTQRRGRKFKEERSE